MMQQPILYFELGINQNRAPQIHENGGSSFLQNGLFRKHNCALGVALMDKDDEFVLTRLTFDRPTDQAAPVLITKKPCFNDPPTPPSVAERCINVGGEICGHLPSILQMQELVPFVRMSVLCD